MAYSAYIVLTGVALCGLIAAVSGAATPAPKPAPRYEPVAYHHIYSDRSGETHLANCTVSSLPSFTLGNTETFRGLLSGSNSTRFFQLPAGAVSWTVCPDQKLGVLQATLLVPVGNRLLANQCV